MTFHIYIYILGISSSQLTFIYFFRGVGIPPTSDDLMEYLTVIHDVRCLRLDWTANFPQNQENATKKNQEPARFNTTSPQPEICSEIPESCLRTVGDLPSTTEAAVHGAGASTGGWVFCCIFLREDSFLLFFLNVFFMLFQWAQPHDIPSGNLLHSYWKWW